MNINEVLRYLPHRYPFLLIDKVLSYEPHKNIVAIKNVTINENFFVGHFPGKPVMPGVLIVESMAQSAAFLMLKSHDVKDGIFYLTGIDNAKFRSVVIPGDTLINEVSITKLRGGFVKFSCISKVEDRIVAESEISAMMEK